MPQKTPHAVHILAGKLRFINDPLRHSGSCVTKLAIDGYVI